MRYRSLDDFLARGRAALAKGPVALIFAEDLVEVDSTIRHHQKAGFRQILVFAPPALRLEDGLDRAIHRIDHATAAEGKVPHRLSAPKREEPSVRRLAESR